MSLVEKFHEILHELEAKLQAEFGSHPKIAEHVAAAKVAVTDAVNPSKPESTSEQVKNEALDPEGTDSAVETNESQQAQNT